ncbi:Cilia- and flagella-associated protein 47 [Geranomyces variabilis]|uniref:Cilia- and flagella-associated protein 47 n=1 Tax=Geranomyces variabilis TaxID=109894 RepID=A0AAD5XMG4_9FUNG|nr:Cilia- and flagella-associated protein 47 [Geranomyces variabilis]
MSWNLAGGEAAKGTRVTPFTSLIAVSSRSSLAALQRDQNLAETFYSLRVFPQRIVVLDYAPGTVHTHTIKVTNLTRRVKWIAFQYPGGKRFRVKNGPKSWQAVAPGLDIEVELDFIAPELPGSQLRDGEDPTLMQYTDKLTVVAEGHPDMVVDLEAFPAGPRLEVDAELDFRTAAVNANDEWVTGFVSVKNVGQRKARVKVVCDPDLPIRVSPARLTLSAQNDVGSTPPTHAEAATSASDKSLVTMEGQIKVEFRPHSVGEFLQYLQVELENDVPRSSTARKHNTTVALRANVIDHKLAFLDAKTSKHLDPGSVDFGTVYYSQVATLHTKLENRGPDPVRWVITHAGENKPIVPGPKIREALGISAYCGEESSAGDPDEGLFAMTVQPSEGVIQPFQSIPVVFLFSPRAPVMPNGFKFTQQPPDSRKFRVPMELKIVNSSAHPSETPGEHPIHIELKGVACPVLARISDRTVRFRAVALGERVVTELTLRNDSSDLPFAYSLAPVAQFHADPPAGVVGAQETTTLQIIFRPNQLGNFKTRLLCAIKTTAGQCDGMGNVRFGSEKVFQQIPLKLLGACVASSKDSFRHHAHIINHPRLHPEQSVTTENRTDMAEWATATIRDPISRYGSDPQSLIEADSSLAAAATSANRQDVAHRAQYTRYLRERRAQRVHDIRTHRLGKDGVDMDVETLDLAEALLEVDRDNGLLPPEPVDFMNGLAPHTSNVSQKFGLSPAREGVAKPGGRRATGDKTDIRKLHALFEQLLEPSFHKDKTHTLEHPPSTAAASGFDTPLSGADLANIYAARGSIDFGKVTSHSTNSAPLNLLNALPSGQPIHITISIDGSHSATSSDIEVYPSHQIIAPMTVAGFEVRLCSHTSGVLERKITYIVNGRYKYSLPVRVEVVPVALELGIRTLSLEVDPSRGIHEASQIPTAAEHETVLKNTGNYEAGFEWVLPTDGKHGDARLEGRFLVHPASGIVPPKGSVKLTISYSPGIKAVDEAELSMQVLDPEARKVVQVLLLQCKGSTPASHCVLVSPAKQGAIDLGVLSVGYPSSLGALALLNLLYATMFRIDSAKSDAVQAGFGRIKIKNSSANPAVFTARNESPHARSEAHVEPKSGTIPAASAVELALQCVPTVPGLIEETAIITTVGGGRVIRVPYKYEAHTPEIVFDETYGDLGKGTVIGSSGTKRVIMTNKGNVSAGVVIDLRDFHDFEVKLRDASVLTARKVSTPVPRPRTTSARHRRIKEVETPAKNSHLIQSLGSDHMLYNFDNCTWKRARSNHNRTGKIFLIEVPAGEDIVAEIVFVPTRVARYDFDLSMYLIGSTSVPTIRIEAEGLQSPLHISRSLIDFKNRVVHRGDGHSVSHLKSASKETLILTNESKNSMEWWFDLDPLDRAEKVFKIESWRNVLEPGASQTVTVTFQPESTGLFEVNVPLHVDYLGPKPLLHVPLQGFGVEPSLAFDPPEIFMPITPAGVASTAVFSIINYGCERTEIREVIPDEISGLLELSFPEGKLLKSDGEKLTVVARFVGSPDMPLSFTTKLRISNDGRRAFYLPVHGTSDTSLLTLQSYKWLNMDREVVPDTLTENQKRNRILNGVRPFKTPSGIPLEHGPDLSSVDSLLTSIGETLIHWLEDHVSLPGASKAFPHEIVNSRGQFLQDLVHSISGRRVAPPHTSNPAATTEDQLRALNTQNIEILTYLSSVGALISAVKPEYLLSFDEYKLLQQLNLAQQKRDMGAPIYEEHHEYKQKIERFYSAISKDTWCTLLLQIVRVFVTLPVTLRQLRTLPGVDKAEMTMDWQPLSKARGSCENALLRWIAFHAWRMTGKTRPYISFAAPEFQGDVALAHLLCAHISNLRETTFRHLKDTEPTDDTTHATQVGVHSALANLFPGFQTALTSLAKMREGGLIGKLNAFLLTLFLYQTLPAFVPKGLVEFKCKLNEQVRRELELANPSSRTLTYVPELRGVSDFILPEAGSAGQAVSIGPKSTARLPVEFKSRFCRSVTGSLILRSKKLGLNCASLLVFDLRSVVADAVPARVVKVEGVVYATPPSTTEIEVINPFSMRGRFKINLNETHSPEHEGNPPSFQTQSHVIALDGNQSGALPITFLPFVLGSHTCTIHFIDENVGEFAYQIVGRGLTPHPTEAVSWTAKSGEPLEKSFRVSLINAAREKAVQHVLGGKARKNRKGSTDNLNADGPLSVRKAMRFKVEYSSNMFKGPSEIIIKPPVENNKDKKHVSADYSHTDLPIVFHPKTPGKYTARILLTCLDASDIRLYSISAVAISEGSRATLQFSVPARQTVLQDIPIVNRTDEDWSVKAQMQGSKQFTGLNTLTVHAHGTTNYTVSFAPQKAGESAAVLTLSNLQTAQKHVYTLRGIGLDPAPAGTRNLACRALEKMIEKFNVHNATEQDVEFDVTTDLPFSAGAPTIRVPAGHTSVYELVIQPRRSGSVERAVVTFTNTAEGSYVWYLLSLQVHPPAAEETIPVETTVRKPILLDIPLYNPLEKDVIFVAQIVGSGLSGDNQLSIPARSEKVYVLTFHPMIKMQGTGTIKFYSEEVGEFWYNLSLSAKEGPPMELTPMSCPLGKSCSCIVPLRNPLDKPVTLSVALSNASEFQLAYPAAADSLRGGPSEDPCTELQITVPARESADMQLVFWPTSLTETVRGMIKVSSVDIGDFVFYVQGQGENPTPFDPTVITSQLENPSTSSVTFTNPLPDAIAVTITLEQSGTEFSLVHNRQKKISVEGLQSVSIPFMFRPARMVGHEANIVIKMEGAAGFTWVYPIKGIPERTLGAAPFILETRSRETLEREIELSLPGFISGSDAAGSEDTASERSDDSEAVGYPLFTFRVVPVATTTTALRNPGSLADREMEAEAAEALQLSLVHSKATGDVAVVRFKANWTPPRPATVTLHLFITHPSTSSTWRSTIRLLSHPPSLDDTIVIEGALNKLSCVSFIIRSAVPHDRPFRAFFTGRVEEAGRGEFAVIPREGILVPEERRGEDGNTFVVGYRAREYGKTTIGILVVECEDISWTFELRGVTPASTLARSYSPGSSSRAMSGRHPARTSVIGAERRAKPTVLSRTPRNFIRENAIKPIVARVNKPADERGIEA